MYKIYVNGTLFSSSESEDLALIDPVVTLEVNRAGTFEFTVPPDHPFYELIENRKQLIEVRQNGETIFIGKAVGISTDFYRQRRVTCEGCLSYLNDSIQRQAEYRNMSVRQLLTAYITGHNSQVEEEKRFAVGTVTVTDPNNSLRRFTNNESTMKTISDDLVSSLGGYIRVRRSGTTYFIDYLAEPARTCAQTIRIGRNIIDMNSNLNSIDVASVCIPLGARQEEQVVEGLDKRLDITAVNDGKDYVENESTISNFGRISKVVVWDDVTIPENLKEKAIEWLNSTQYENLVITVTAFDLSLSGEAFDSFKILDNIRVVSEYHGIDRYFLCSKMTYHLNDPASNALTLGLETEKTLSSAAYEIKKEIEMEIVPPGDILREAKDNATSILVNGGKGYVYFDYDENNVIRQILIMDTNSKTTATKVWRWNENGLGYSKNGINGPYETAITKDGQIVADFITVGTLNANLIKAGILSDAAGKYVLDMSTGTVTMKNANILGGSIKIQSANTGDSIIELNSGNTKSSFMPSGVKMVNSLNESNITADWVEFKSSSHNINTTVTAEGVTLRNGDINTANYNMFGVHIDDPDNGSKANTDYVDIRNDGFHVGTHKTNGSLNNMANIVPDQLSFKTQDGEQRAIYPAMSTLITNLDTELNTGIFRFNSDAVGNPLGTNQGLMFAIKYGTNSGFQLVTSNRGGTTNRRKMMIRHRYNGTWTPWATINASITPIGTMHEATPSAERMALVFPTATWDSTCYVDLEEGVWEVKAKARWATNAVGDRRLYVGTLATGTQQMCNEDASQNARTTTGTSTFITNSGTTTVRVYLRVYQTSGSSILLDGAGNADFNGIRAVKIGEVQA